MFNPHTDYKTEFTNQVNALIKTDIPDRTERMEIVNQLCERYISSVGERPDSYPLYLLANYVLAEEMKTKSPSKTKQTGMITENQMNRIRKTETSIHSHENNISSNKRTVSVKKRITTEKEFE